MRRFSVVKLLLWLLVIGGFGLLVGNSCVLFFNWNNGIPIWWTLAFLAEIGLLIWFIILLRSWRYKHLKPSFQLVFWPLVAVVLICAFAGVQPLAGYKDNLVTELVAEYNKVLVVQPPSGQTVVPPSAVTPAEPIVAVPPDEQTVTVIVPPPIITPIQSKPIISTLGLEAEIHTLINAERRNFGILELEYDTSLGNIARQHSEDMADRNYFSHDSPEGLGPTERAKANGYNCYKDFGSYYYDGIAENIFQNWLYSTITYYNGIPTYDWDSQSEIAVSTVEGWMGSLGHRGNILDADYSKEGIGVAISADGKVYITQDFW